MYLAGPVSSVPLPREKRAEGAAHALGGGCFAGHLHSQFGCHLHL